MNTFASVTLNLLSGFGMTCLIFIVTLVLALPLGLVVSFGSMSKWTPFAFINADRKKKMLYGLKKFRPIAFIVRVFVWIIRGTPLMLQLFVVFYLPGMLFKTTFFNRFEATIIAFVINYSCYFSEIYRGGIEGVPKGQYEAGQVLGMTKYQIFFHVTLLQVIKRIVPPMSNEIITLVKDTSLARVIAVVDIIFVAQRYVTSEALLWPLFYTGVYYLLFCGILTLLFGWIEKKLSFFRV